MLYISFFCTTTIHRRGEASGVVPRRGICLDGTSHIQWFRERGVGAQAVVVVRDPGMHFQNTIQKYCPNETATYEQYGTARDLSSQAITSINPVLVSYEMPFTLKSSYLFQM